MQTARHLVGAFVELTAGVQYGHHHFKGAAVLFLVHVNRDTASVILYGDGVVFVDGYFDVRAVACQCLIDGVVYGLIHEMVQTLLADVTDVHGGAFSHSLQAFQDLDVAGGVFRPVHLSFIHCCSSLYILIINVTKLRNNPDMPK